VTAPDPGYAIRLDELGRLCSDPAYSPTVLPLLRAWFGCQPDRRGAFLGPGGGRFTLEALHEAIQADGDKQRALYNAAMSLWR
jgi:hypothetical protein